MKKHIIFSFFLIFITGVISAKDSLKTEQFTNPLNVPLVLNGNFAELRTNHFHTGLDFKTNGRTGLEVKAVMSGDISRIKVSPSGYGKALYIDHPNGTTSVYAHLLSFNDSIDKYIKSIQYKKESFAVDIPVPKGKLKVKQGEEIALSGNSGSSAGPHLHFEIRDTKTQQPLNPLNLGYSLPDKIKPRILSVYIYPLSDSSHINGSREKQRFETVYYDGKFHIKRNPLIKVYGDIGFGVEAIDYFDGSWSKCGIYSLEMLLDKQPKFEFSFDTLNFSTTRYINSHIDFEQKFNRGKKIHKSFLEKGNKLEIYNDTLSGVLQIPNPSPHKVSFIIKDYEGNKALLDIRLLSKKMKLKSDSVKSGTEFFYNKPNSFETSNFKIETPSGCFYKNLNFIYETDSIIQKEALSPVHKIHLPGIPVHKFMKVAIKPDSIPPHLKSKVLIASVNNRGKFYAIGGEFENGWLRVRLREFGNYCVAVDTVPPKIIPLSIQRNAKLTESKRIRFRIKDDFSGISTYKGTIDGKWVLFEYDAKNDLLTYSFDKGRFEFKKKHNLVLEIKDIKGNSSIYKATFIK